MSLTNYWKSNQCQIWCKPVNTTLKNNFEDFEEHERKIITSEYVRKIKKLCEGLKLPQRVMSTAIVYFKRFYQK
jgi:hypothetical protein